MDGNKSTSYVNDRELPKILILLLDEATLPVLYELTALPSITRPMLLIISAKNDNHQMRLAMQAGARDFFTDPVDSDELHKALEQIIHDCQRTGAKKGTLTTLINAKGGSGASVIACNLAHIASIASDESVVLMDMDFQFGTQSLNLDLHPQHTVVEALTEINDLDFDAIDGYMTRTQSGLRLLSTLQQQIVLPGDIPVENLDKMLSLCAERYNRVFIDLPRHIDLLTASVLDKSDQIAIVIQQSLAHLRDAKRLVQILKLELNVSDKNIIIVVNRFNPKANLQIKDIKSTLNCSRVYLIPNDYDRVANACNLGVPLFDYSPKAPITRAMIKLASHLDVDIKEKYKEHSFFKRLVSFF
ncbi:AAA family ATPase [Methylomarinum sp. Ch1-1]|uniref:AAA family ATPase n=1 Tax=Methylomarinum roseum TaxID=3067653 RepID=A0AAU7NT32_9GAMM|nr:AAA family ATPase [Methylomarinum sp. Ch1-1]MDP4519874.1 AAA family ATPase [Methylomarinum sp. Ch1-1]